jgi:hypothetical protein
MSFFDNPKNFGTAMLLAGLISALVSLVGIITEALDSDRDIGLIVISAGVLIYGLMIAAVGQKIRVGEISQRIKILGSFIAVVGAGFIVKGFFSMVGETLDSDLAGGVVIFFISLILGIVAMYISRTITDGQTTTMDRVFWIILMVIFVIMIILSIAEMISAFDGESVAIGVLNAIAGLCNVIVYVSLVVVLMSDDVKKELGMA